MPNLGDLPMIASVYSWLPVHVSLNVIDESCEPDFCCVCGGTSAEQSGSRSRSLGFGASKKLKPPFALPFFCVHPRTLTVTRARNRKVFIQNKKSFRNGSLPNVRCWYRWLCGQKLTLSVLIRPHLPGQSYFEHSKREYHEPHKDSGDRQDWGLTLEALPPRGGGSAECPKRTRGEWDAGVENKNTENTQIDLNKWKLSEPWVYLKPVEQTLYSAAVPIKKSVRHFVDQITPSS